MTARSVSRTKEEKPPKSVQVVVTVISIATVLIRTFGWAGSSLIAGMFLVNSWATSDQKQRIVEAYVLGTNISNRYPLIITCAVFVLLLLAQRKWHGIDKEKLKKEIGRKDGVISDLEVQMNRKRTRGRSV